MGALRLQIKPNSPILYRLSACFPLDTAGEKIKYAPMRILYNIVWLIIAIPVLLYLLLKMLITGKYRHSLLQKLGAGQKHLLADIPAGQTDLGSRGIRRRGDRSRADCNRFKKT